MKRTLRVVVLGDLHFGAVPPDRLERELDETLFQWLEGNTFDALIQAGDYFDKRLSLDSDDSKAAIRTAVRLCQLCQTRGVPFRILHGTITHDHHQTENFRPLETEYSCFRIVQSAQHEELVEGFNVLWMPEQYPADYNEFYSPFFFQEIDGEVQEVGYDAIFGHGEIDVAAGWGRADEGERHYGGTPCHEAEDLLGHCFGPVWFGHVHKRFRHKRRLGYPGSFTRWCHGEEDPKGFDVLTLVYNEKKGDWKVTVEAVENAGAPPYRQVAAASLLSAVDAVDEMVLKIREEASSVYRLRVRVEDFPIGIEELSLLRGAFAGEPGVEIVAAARPVSEGAGADEDADEDAGAREERRERMSYLRDPNLPGEERLLRYMQEKFPDQTDITVEEIRELTAPVA
jgi:hypothetical protein